MNDEFRGFDVCDISNLHASLLLGQQCRKYVSALLRRLGPRVARAVPSAGRDTRGGRDYFFEQVEFFLRGRPDRSFIGFYHYSPVTETPGSFFEVWETEHDEEPIVRHELQHLISEVQSAWESGHLGDFLDGQATAIRFELGL